MYEELQSQVYFVYEREIEYLLAGAELLVPYHINPKIWEAYDVQFVEEKKREFPLLFEFYKGMSKENGLSGLGFIEFLLEYNMKDFRLEQFYEYLKKLPKERFLSKFLQEPKEKIRKIMSSEQEQILYYQEKPECFQSYFSVEILFQKTEWLLETYFRFVQELATKQAEKYLSGQEPQILNWKDRIAQGVQKEGPLHYSEIIMGKSFYNRGPYKNVYFMPSVFMPMMACRWFGEDQILMFDGIRWDNPGSSKMADMLKMLGDKTRYRILVLLKERVRLSGVEIAESMNLSTSTVSHHMTQLKNSGLINEESAGNTKYYSVNEYSIKNCIDILGKTFLN